MAIDKAFYTDPLLLSSSSAHSVGSGLLNAMPEKAPAGVRRAAEDLRAALIENLAAWNAAAERPEPGALKPVDARGDASWRALHLRLSGAWERPDGDPHAAIAERLLAT